MRIANKSHYQYAAVICDTIAESAKIRGTGIAKRTPEYIMTKMDNGNAVIALEGDTFAGFCYIEVWGHEKFVANSGLIVHPDFRNQGLAKEIKKAIFNLSRSKFPNAKIFGITTGLAVMKINYDLGYEPVTFSELTDDPAFGMDAKHVKILIFSLVLNVRCVSVQGCYTIQLKKKRTHNTNMNITEKCFND